METIKNSKIFFIATGIGIVITIVLTFLSIYYGMKAYDISSKTTNAEQSRKVAETEDLFKYVAIVTGSITGVLLTTGIILRIKEKGGIEIVS